MTLLRTDGGVKNRKPSVERVREPGSRGPVEDPELEHRLKRHQSMANPKF